jgi:uncharacterized protein (TIGR02300 family)
MHVPELGEKRACVTCAARFYDLCRKPAVCPMCQAVQPPDKPRTVRVAVVPRATWSRGGPKPARVADEAAEVDRDAEADIEDADEEADDADEDEDHDDEGASARNVE